ncbi:MAG TPA: hypothetical protein PKY77_23670 [Phycisphaerae bacterium]|nr:hypothetical protein [Phycisphaerae bacterium]HRY69732.1 hypothetical protein [Phycisphaerae bacterium]HSA29372.1 hypothetical protein [Phycisphaerae bacterium]
MIRTELIATVGPACGLIDDVQEGHRVLIDDGNIRLKAIGKRQDEPACRQMALLYGVIPIRLDLCQGFRAMLSRLDEVLLPHGLADKRDRIVVVADTRPDVADEIDAVFVHLFGSTAPEAHTA